MNKRLIVITFIIGAIALESLMLLILLHPPVWMIEHIYVAGNGNGVISVSDNSNVLPLILFLIIGAAFAFLLAQGFMYRDADRWLAFTFAGFLLTGLCVSTMYSLGGFLWPAALILLAVSLWKLSQYRKIGNTPKEDLKG